MRIARAPRFAYVMLLGLAFAATSTLVFAVPFAKAQAAEGCSPDAYWKFDGSSAPSVTADSAFGADGTLTNNPEYSTDVPGVGFTDSHSLAFSEPSDQGVTVSHDVTDTFTITMWIKPSTQADGWGALLAHDGNEGLYFLGNDADPGFQHKVSFYEDSGDHVINETLTPGKWYHLAFVSSGGEGTFYVNGKADATVSDVVPTTLDHIGTDSGHEAYNGLIDDVRVYDNALSAAQVKAIAGGSSNCVSGHDMGLVAHWKLDETSGSVAHDDTGNGNDGTVLGDQLWVAGKAGNGFNFEGDDINNFITIGSPSADIPIGQDAYTLSAWMKSDGAGGSQGIIGWGDYGSEEQVTAFRLDSDQCTSVNGLITYWWGDDFVACAGKVNLYDRAWHLVTTTFDGTKRKTYVDGKLLGTNTPTGTHAVTSRGNLALGVTDGDLDEYFNGTLDDVRVYNRALSASEITTLYGPTEHHSGGSYVMTAPASVPPATTPPEASAPLAPSPATPPLSISHDMTLGSQGDDVRALQVWLIGKGFTIPAGATGYFGRQTQTALAAMQKVDGINPALGYFGPLTRAYLASH